MTRKSSFAPIVRSDTTLLLLGSLPGEASLSAARYYAHPRNQFWRLVGSVIGRKELHHLCYEQKLAALARAMAVGTSLLLLDEPFEGVAPALSKRLADVIAGLKGTEVSVLIAQSDLNHSRKLVDREFVIERGANLEKSNA